MKNFLLKTICFFVFLLTIPVLYIHGQVNIIGDFVNITINPTNPSPGEQVRVNLQSSSINLGGSKITWYINDKEKETGVGLSEYYLQAGAAGKTMKVSARIETANGTKPASLSFAPAGVDLIFEALSYTPPFYKGKTLNPMQGSVIVAAFPEVYDENMRKLATNELIFNWKKDGIVVQSASGQGKNYLNFSGSIPARDTLVEVSVTSLDSKLNADASITIVNSSPEIIFYENSPIYGIMMNKAITNTVKMSTDEFSVIAVPYFFSSGYATTPDLNYVWSMDGMFVDNQDPKNSFATRVEKAGSGTANISLKIDNIARIFQTAENNYLVNFEKQ